MKAETIAEIKETFKVTVRAQVGKGGHVRWGEAESLAVVEALCDVLLNNEDAQADGFDAIRENVRQVVNPSAFAQKLEDLPIEHPSHIRRPKRGTRTASTASEL